MFLSYLAMFLEFFISMMLAVGIILLCIRLAGSLVHIPDLDVYPNYEDLLESCFELIIGVELIRMMYYHTPDTVFEVLVFCHCTADYQRPFLCSFQPDRRMCHRRFVCHKKISFLRIRSPGEKYFPCFFQNSGDQ